MAQHLGEFEQLVLLALLRLGPEAYGMTVREEIAARTARDVSISAVYTTLERMERKGYVASRVGEPSAERGGRRKKHYELAATGQRALDTSYRALREMAEGLDIGASR